MAGQTYLKLKKKQSEMNMTIKELCKLSHKMAVDKGFWHKCSTGEVYQRNISELLMLIVTELGEACEALRNNNRQCYEISTKNKEWEKDTFEDEIADSFIRLADMCEALGIDIEWQIKQKMAYNKTRPKKHGKEF
jgi:NTP pyrophosphatase (non-canonical NTP hydrolase)